MAQLPQRIEYETAGLDLGDLAPEPVTQWWTWYRQAEDAGCTEPHAMTVSTVDLDGAPDARLVLVRDVDERGFSFFTNYESAKSRQLAASGHAALTFAWLELHRQVRVRGRVERVSASESDDYFASRPRGSQLGAWASPQSLVISSREELDRRVAAVEDRFTEVDVPRPEHWGGWRVVPNRVEFWQGRPSRLHDRLRYRLVDGAWVVERLAP
ncbi:MAG: pyridoxamine 5'-phosphate oxidase [Ilumatobacteraceae bacterium]